MTVRAQHANCDAQAERRQFLAALGGAALLGAAPGLPHAAPLAGAFEPDLELELRAVPDQVAILGGPTTGVWRYRAKVLQGDAASVRELPDSYLGPVIRVRRGSRVRVHFINQLPQPSVVHWHGMLVPDGPGIPGAAMRCAAPHRRGREPARTARPWRAA